MRGGKGVPPHLVNGRLSSGYLHLERAIRWRRQQPGTAAVVRPRVRRSNPMPLRPEAVARDAGLRYVNDESPGIRRVKSGRSFRYVDPDGRPVRDPETLARIKALVIPPAWTEVWICPRADGHIQATGRDDRGRKQYRYHARWRSVRDEAKYGRTLAFGRALSKIRTRHRTRPETPRPAAAQGPGGRRPAAGDDPDPHRQRRIRPRQPLVRPDDDARPPCQRSGRDPGIPLPGQERHPSHGRDRRPPAGAGRPAMPGAARPGAAPVHRRGRRGPRRSARTTSTRTSARSPARTSRPRTSGRGRAPSWP